MIDSGPPDVILVELGLPRMPAGRLTRWLAQDERTRHIPVIVLAGDTDPEGEPPATAAGLLVKPFRLATMLEEVRRVIRSNIPPG